MKATATKNEPSKRTVTTSTPDELGTQSGSDGERPKNAMYDKDEVKSLASGRWPEIITTLAGIDDDYLVTRERSCPKCGGNTRWRCFEDFRETGGAICSHCGLGHRGSGMIDGFQVLMWALKIEFPQTVNLVGEFVNAPTSEKSLSTGWKKTSGKGKKKTSSRKCGVPPLPSETVSLRHRVYTRFGELCGLSDADRAGLRERGLSDAEIDKRGFFSASKNRGFSEIIKRLFREFHNESTEIARLVPGVFRGGESGISIDRWCMFINVRDADGNVIALQKLSDGPGSKEYSWFSSRPIPDGKESDLYPTVKSRPHIAIPASEDRSGNSLRFTEGPLKADVATVLSGVRTVGVAGVGLWDRAIDTIESYGCKRLLLSFDADHATNDKVAKSLKEAYEYFTRPESSLEVAIETWETTQDENGEITPKGIDDALLAGSVIRVLEGDEAKAFVDSLGSSETTEAKSTEIKIPVTDPERLANENIAAYRETGRDIRHWQGEWYTYKGKRWEPRKQTYIRARIRGFIESRFRDDCEELTDWWKNNVDKGKYESDEAAEKARPKKLAVTGTLVGNVADAVQTLCILPDHIDMGCMLPDRTKRNFWAVSNGLLDLDKLAVNAIEEVVPHTPNWFSDHCHDYSVDMQAECPEWENFLNQVFFDRSTGLVDIESIATLQRWFGYCLMDHTKIQKMLILDGVSRSGKGVISRILKRLVGESFTTSPKLFQLGGEFGLQPFLGKHLAVIGDAKLNRGKHDLDSILETLLGIIGQDSIDVAIKKEKTKTTVDLKTKFMLLCNGIPTLNDPAMAIVNRVVILKFNNSFAGNEDTELTNKLLQEMDGIFRWALLGFCHVHDDPRLPQPESGMESLENFKRAVSPIRGFVDECCHLRDMEKPDQPEFIVGRDDLYDAWIGYCHECGRDHPGTRTSFFKQLTTAYSYVREFRPREGEYRPHKVVNIELSKEGREKRDQKRDRDEKRNDAG